MTADSEIRFLRRLQRLLEEGQFTSTYKFALLQALADLSVERDADLDGSLRLPIAAIAEKFIEYYWRQLPPFRADAGAASAGTLLQNTDRQAAILQLLAHARSRYDGMLAAARQDSDRFDSLRTRVARVIRQMPLWKLQTIGRQNEEFLYRREDYRQADDTIRLLAGVAGSFRSFHGLVTHLVRGAWVEQIRRIPANRQVLGEATTLPDFLFGTNRAALSGYRNILHDHQGGRCFYCDRRVARNGDLDHFIAWSRYPVDLGHNFVFTHSECNRAKRDYLAHPAHLQRWAEQNLDHGEALSGFFADAKLPHDIHRSRQVAVWAYEQGERSSAHVWLRGKDVGVLAPEWRNAIISVADMRLAAEQLGPIQPV